MAEWRERFRNEHLRSRSVSMGEVLNAADRSSYGIFDCHYLRFAVYVRSRRFDLAAQEIDKIYSINIANKIELQEHFSVARLLSLLLKKYVGEIHDDRPLIGEYEKSRDSNHRFLWGFASGGYLGLDFIFPLFGQIVSACGTYIPLSSISREALRDQMISAADSREPFSYVRYNDGEGCLLYALDKPQMTLADSFEHHVCIASLWHGWFGTQFTSAPTSMLNKIGTQLHASIQNASVAGLDLGVLRGWRNVKGLESKVGCYYSALKVFETRGSKQCIDSGCLYALQEDSGFTLDFLREHQWSIITCHKDIKTLFCTRGIAIQEVLVTPAEQRFNELFGTPVQSNVHLDSVYPSLCDHISSVDSESSHFWIIAAGPLGKIYAEKLRQRGCFVLDLGAIVDGIIGFNRRPRLSAFSAD